MKKEIWVFGSHDGHEYGDNSKALFEYASSQKDVKAVWLAKSTKVVNEVKSNGFKAFSFFSLSGIYHAFFSKKNIVSHSLSDLPTYAFLRSRCKKNIQLWHGTPLKRLDVGNKRSLFNKVIRYIFLVILGSEYNLVTVSTSQTKEVLAKFFNVNQSVVKITGYPRNDSLLIQNNKSNVHKLLNIKQNSKLIFYMPTFREYSQDDKTFNLFIKYGFNFTKMESFLREQNAHLIIKLHPRDYKHTKKVLKGIRDRSNLISIIKPGYEHVDLYKLLNASKDFVLFFLFLFLFCAKCSRLIKELSAYIKISLRLCFF